ncbi:MAG: proline dehydrogenase family protein, partial [Acidimicrobiia bacterium]
MTTAGGSQTDAAVLLAERLLIDSARFTTRSERKRARRLARLVQDEGSRAMLVEIADQVVRIRQPDRAARRFAAIVRERAQADALGIGDRVALRAGAIAAPLFPRAVMPLVVRRLRKETRGVILPAESEPFARHVARRSAAGMRLNVNVLGEAILGEEDAECRLQATLRFVERPDVDYVSVKISSISSHINVLAFEDTVERVAARLRRLYAAAEGAQPKVFVNLDMEEYRDLDLTLSAFATILSEPQFLAIDAGIVLQAYLPDSFSALQALAEFALERRENGGGRVKVRIVKGANLAMEQVEAEMRGWEQAPYATKAEVDANYKRLLDLALDPKYADALRIGVASHNLFDVAWALERRGGEGAADRLEIEMLEGMANPQARAVAEAAGSVLLYAPVVHRREFDAAIAYLVRRLDENAAPDNFLRNLFTRDAASREWERERHRFLDAVARRNEVSTEERRTQDRRAEEVGGARTTPERFLNEADTDFALEQNRDWIADHLRAYRPARSLEPVDADDVDSAVDRARKGGQRWRGTSRSERRSVLFGCADELARRRGSLVAAMAEETGKTVLEGDPEVSEAIDFARYYAHATEAIEDRETEGLRFDPYGTVVVTSPWNFPLAIPAGGVFAALAAGGAVILKPAPEAVGIGRLLAEACWSAGVPDDVLQFVPAPDDDVGRRLIVHSDVDAVILTGSHDTARMFLDWRPSLNLHAETSGKDAIVVTAAADLDAAVRDIVRSAFGHAGQKCSAASLAILEGPVYDDRRFLRQLADAVRSLIVGPATELATTMGPLIAPPRGPLADALCKLDEDERWLVEPEKLDDAGMLWTPGVKLGVSAGSAFHLTECFGPVLGLMRADDLDHAISLQNGTPFGLTGGIQSLDPVEIDHWLERVEVGNAYVNRPITGAIVARQPFGGWKRSVVGRPAKAGGPNYTMSLGRWTQAGALDVDAARASFKRWWEREFSQTHDPVGLKYERNELRYRRLPKGVLLRIAPEIGIEQVEVAAAAARISGCALKLSSPVSRSDLKLPVAIEEEATLASRLARLSVDRVRVLGPASDVLRRGVHRANVTL